MRSQPVHQVTSVIFAGIGIFLMSEGQTLGVEGMYGPGPGFFPFWVGAALTAVNVLWFALTTFRRADGPPMAITWEAVGMLKVGLVLLALLAFAVALTPLGFKLTMLLLLLFLFVGFGRDYLVAKLVVAILGSFGTHYIFEHILRVPLPYSSLPFLQGWGL